MTEREYPDFNQIELIKHFLMSQIIMIAHNLFLGTVCATIGDTKGAKEHFLEVIEKARTVQSEYLPHFLVNYGMLNIQMVRNLQTVCKFFCTFPVLVVMCVGILP